jgi:hypothetical protein
LETAAAGQLAAVIRLSCESEAGRRTAFTILLDEAARVAKPSGLVLYAEWATDDESFAELLAASGWEVYRPRRRLRVGPLAISLGKLHARASMATHSVQADAERLLDTAWQDEERPELLIATLQSVGGSPHYLAVEHDTEFLRRFVRVGGEVHRGSSIVRPLQQR